MPNNLLPQSALPVGQTPLATIQAPRVAASIPNPMDVTNFFRMQQGIQNNVGLLQQNEALKLRKQELDFRNYALMVKETENMLNMINGAYGDFYNNKTQSRNSNASTATSSLAGGLDPTYRRHEDTMRRQQKLLSDAEEEAYKMGINFLQSGSRDPASLLETSRGIRNHLAKSKEAIRLDKEYSTLTNMHRAYNDTHDRIEEFRNKGYHVNAKAVDEFESKYTGWANGDPKAGNITLADFRIDNFVYDGGGVFKGISDDADALFKPSKEFEAINVQDAVLKGTRETVRPLNEVVDILDEKYRNNKDARALFDNVYAGRVKADGTPYEFRDFIEDNVAVKASPEDKLSTVTADSGTPIIKSTVGTKAANTKKGSAKDTTTVTSDIMDELDADARTGLILGRSRVAAAGFDPSRFSVYDLVNLGNSRMGQASVNEDGTVTYKLLDDDNNETGETVTINPIKEVDPKTQPAPLQYNESGIDTGVIRGNEQASTAKTGGISSRNDRTGIFSVREEFKLNPDGTYKLDKDGNKISKGMTYGSSQLFGDTWNAFVADMFDYGSDAEGVSKMLKEYPHLDGTKRENEEDVMDFIERIQSEVGDKGFMDMEDQFLFKTKWSPAIQHAERRLGRKLSPAVNTFIADSANHHGLVKPHVIDRAMNILNANDQLDKNNDQDVLLALEQARIDYLNERTGGTITREDADSMIENRVAPLAGRLINSMTAGAVTNQPSVQGGDADGVTYSGTSHKELDELVGSKSDFENRFIANRGDDGEYTESNQQPAERHVDFKEQAKYIVDNDVKLPNGRIKLGQPIRNMHIKEGPASMIDEMTPSQMKTALDIRYAKKAKIWDKMDRLENHMVSINQAREVEALSKGEEFSPLDIMHDDPSKLSKKYHTRGKNPMSEYRKLFDSLFNDESLDTLTLEDALLSDSVKNAMMAHMLPEQAAQANAEFAKDILDEVESGDNYQSHDRRIIIKPLKSDTNLLFVSKDGKSKTIPKEDLAEYVADNLQDESFLMYPPEDIYTDMIAELQGRVNSERVDSPAHQNKTVDYSSKYKKKQ